MKQKNVLFLCIILNSLAVFMDVTSATPLVLSLGGNLGLVANLVSLRSTITFFVTPLLGNLADTKGRRLVMLLTSAGLCIGFLIIANAGNLFTLILGRILFGLSYGFPVGALAYLSDITPENELSGTLGIARGMLGVGYVVASPIGGVISSYYGYNAPAFLSSAVALINLLIVYFFVVENPKRNNSKKLKHGFLESFKNIYNLFLRPKLRPVLILKFGCDLSTAIINFSLLEYMRSTIGFNTQQQGFLLMSLGIVTIFTMLFVDRLVNFFGGQKNMVCIGYGVGSLAALLIPLSTSRWYFISFLCVFFVFTPLQPAVVAAMLSKLVPNSEQGLAMSYVESTVSFGNIFGPLFVGILLQESASIFLSIFGSCALTWCVLTYFYFGYLPPIVVKNKKKKNKK